MRWTWILALSCACAPWAPQAIGQDQPKLNARELFYTPPPADNAPAPAPKAAQVTKKSSAKTVAKKSAPKKAAPAAAKENPAAEAAPQQVEAATPAPPAPQAAPARSGGQTQFVPVANVKAMPLGLRYSVLKRNASGEFTEVDADSEFHSGDRIRIQVEANTTGYLYVVMQGTSGNWRLLFPSKDIAGGSNVVQRGETRQIPGGGSGQFVFDQQAGTEKLFLVLSRQPEADLDKLIYSIKDNGKNSDAQPPHTLMASVDFSNQMISRLRQQVVARDLVFEKSDEDENGKPEKAAYVVNPSTAPDARLVVDLTLKHN